MALTLSLRKDRDRSHRTIRDHAEAAEAVRRHLEKVEIGSPLLYPY